MAKTIYTAHDTTGEDREMCLYEFEAESDTEAVQIAEEWQRSSYGVDLNTEDGTIWVPTSLFRSTLYEVERSLEWKPGWADIKPPAKLVCHWKVQIDPPEPKCDYSEGHTWERSTPNSKSTLVDRCQLCGLIAYTNTWAIDPEDGEEGLVALRYIKVQGSLRDLATGEH